MNKEKRDLIVMMAAIWAILGWMAFGTIGSIGGALAAGILTAVYWRNFPHGKT